MFQNRKAFFLAVSAGFFLASASAEATDGSSGLGQAFNLFFGDAYHRQARQSQCGTDGDADALGEMGVLGSVNRVLCHVKQDMNINAVGNYTKNYSSSVAKCSLGGSAGSGQFVGIQNNVAYDMNLQCWVALASGASYAPLLNFYFSYASAGAVDRGTLFMDPGAFYGQAGATAAYLVYDLGSTSVPKTLTAKYVGYGFSMRSDGALTAANVLQNTDVVSLVNTSTGYGFKGRFSGALGAPDASGRRSTALAYLELPNGPSTPVDGFARLNPGAAGDTPVGAACFTGTPSSHDLIWSLASSASACGADSLLPFPADSVNTVAAYAPANVLVGVLDGKSWEGMTLAPPF